MTSLRWDRPEPPIVLSGVGERGSGSVGRWSAVVDQLSCGRVTLAEALIAP